MLTIIEEDVRELAKAQAVKLDLAEPEVDATTKPGKAYLFGTTLATAATLMATMFWFIISNFFNTLT